MPIESLLVEKRSRTGATCSTGFGLWTTYLSASIDTLSVSKAVLASQKCGHWRRLMHQGAILPVNEYKVRTTTTARTPYSMDSVKTGFNSSCSRYANEYRGNGYSSANAVSTLTIPNVTTGLLNDAVNRAIADATSGVASVGVTALEAKETFNMLLNMTHRLARVVRDVRELTRKKRITWDQAWLEYSYGWRPLIQDIQSITDAMNAKWHKGQRRSGGGGSNLSFSDSKTTTGNIDSSTRFRRIESLTGSYSISGFALSQVTEPTFAKYGLNPVTTVWEAITLSFVVDMFLNVGAWLASLSTSVSGFDLVSSGVSTRLNYELSVSYSTEFHNTNTGTATQLTVTSVQEFHRQPWVGGGFPSLHLPGFPNQYASLVALLTQALR